MEQKLVQAESEIKVMESKSKMELSKTEGEASAASKKIIGEAQALATS